MSSGWAVNWAGSSSEVVYSELHLVVCLDGVEHSMLNIPTISHDYSCACGVGFNDDDVRQMKVYNNLEFVNQDNFCPECRSVLALNALRELDE